MFDHRKTGQIIPDIEAAGFQWLMRSTGKRGDKAYFANVMFPEWQPTVPAQAGAHYAWASNPWMALFDAFEMAKQHRQMQRDEARAH